MYGGPQSTKRLYIALVEQPLVSVTVMVNVLLPRAVGAPVMLMEFGWMFVRVNPAGNELDVTANVSGGTPPLAVMVLLYG